MHVTGESKAQNEKYVKFFRRACVIGGSEVEKMLKNQGEVNVGVGCHAMGCLPMRCLV